MPYLPSTITLVQYQSIYGFEMTEATTFSDSVWFGLLLEVPPTTVCETVFMFLLILQRQMAEKTLFNVAIRVMRSFLFFERGAH